GVLVRIIQVELVSQIQVRCERTEGARVDQQRSDSSLARPQEILFIPGGALQLQGHGEVMLVALQPMILGTQQYVAEATGAAPGAVVRRLRSALERMHINGNRVVRRSHNLCMGA